MMKKKYFASEGIAFSEKKDLQKLRAFAAQGWIVKRYKGMGYELEQGPKEDVIFSIDVHQLGKGEDEEYFAMFLAGGWEHVCSSYNTHLFKAKPGTPPIYTDKESEAGKFNRLLTSIMPLSLYSLLALVISTVGVWLTTGTLENIFYIIFYITLIIAVPCAMMVIAINMRKVLLMRNV